jgi:CRP/FNR family transcriptional regulator, cyclic AMP receptor protein
MENLERIVTEHPFFSGMAVEHLRLLAGCAKNARFDAGQFILREGEEANEFFLLRHGKVALEVYAPDRGALTIQTMGPGDILGWSWLVPPYKWKFDARVIELTRAISMDGKCLREKSESDCRLGYELLKRFSQVMVDHLQAARLQLLNVYEAH